MKSPDKQNQDNKKDNAIKIFSVPFPLKDNQQNLIINTNATSKPSQEQIFKQAFDFHTQGNIQEATKHYKYLINQGFSDQRAFCNYGVILKDLGKLHEAELSLRKAIELNPNLAEAHSNLGSILKDLGKLHEAELSTRTAIKVNPNYAMAHSNLGGILKDLGKLHEAELSLRKAIELNPNLAEAHSNLGGILKDLGKLHEAELSLRKAIELNPNLAEAHSNLGSILKDLGKLHEAELSLRKAIELNPDLAEAYFNLGNILSQIGKLKDAELYTRKAIKLNSDYAKAHCNLGLILIDLGRLYEAELSTRRAIEIKPDFVDAAWNFHGLSNSIDEAEKRINQCLIIDKNNLKAQLAMSAIKLHQGDRSLFNKLIESDHKNHPWIRSIEWSSNLPKLPELFFHRWALFDYAINKSKKDRPFYEFGVWRGASFQYLINTFKTGYGFDTFEGLPEDWHQEKKGSYSAEGIIPKIEGGKFIAGKFEDTLPTFFSEQRPLASIINFDADLYSSTFCALNYSKCVIDKDTILIFDEFIINKHWEQDEYKALNEFCSNNDFTYEVLAISYTTKQVAVKILDI